MGNSITSDLKRERTISSIENLKQQMGYLDEKHSKKKKNLLFSTATWKRIVESTRKRKNKSKISPAHSYNEGLLPSKNNPHNLKHFTDRSMDKKSQSLHGFDGNNHGVMDTKPVLQQPRIVMARHSDVNKTAIDGQYKHLALQQMRMNTNEGERKSAVVRSHDKPHHNDNPARTHKPPRKVVIQASTSELLECLGHFVCQRCHRLTELEPSDVPSWFRGVDRALIMQGWQDISFIMPSSVVFVYMLCREMLHETINSVFEVQCIVLTCLYMSYSYMGNEISYPLRPFLIEPERYAFWGRCCRIMNKLSGKMLRINNDAQFFTTVFRDLKAYSPRSAVPPHSNYTRPVAPYHIPHSRPIVVGGRS